MIPQTVFESEMLEAMKAECLAVAQSFQGSFVLRTNFKDTGEITYSFPLLMLYVLDAGESHPFCGGGQSVQWNFGMAVYTYDPNAYGEDDSGYSESLAAPIGIVRQHFGSPARLWLTEGLGKLQCEHSFKLTYQGTHKAPPLKYADGLALGYWIMFGSWAYDEDPSQIETSRYPLQSVVQGETTSSE